MPIPIQITARGINISQWWKDKIYRKAQKLNEFHGRITHCRAVVEVPHKHRHKGRLYNIRLDLQIPGGTLIIDREPAPTLNEAIDRAFDAAQRQIEDRVRLRRGFIKHRECPPTGAVTELFPEAGFGFLETGDGRKIYFHRNSVLHEGFKRLTIGSLVHFTEENGREGPQASSVAVVKLAPRPERRRRMQRMRQAATP